MSSASSSSRSWPVPLFLRALLGTIARERISPTADNASLVVGVGPEAVSRSVSLRLARLPPEANALARAAAVLGDGVRLHHAGAVAGIDVEAAARAATVLSRSDLLRREDPLELIHPVVRTAVYQGLAADERTDAHRRAGQALLAAGAPPEHAAAHLMLTLPTGD